MPRKDKQYLVIANSARYIAQAAPASYQLHAVDAFGDKDLLGLDQLVDHAMVPLISGQLDGSALLDVCRDLHKRLGLRRAILGAGLESQIDVIDELSQLFDCANNTATVFAYTSDSIFMNDLLEEEGIVYAMPSDIKQNAVLNKSSQACGGGHIVWSADTGQTYIPGIAVSHLFLANGTAVHSIGFNTLWTSQHDRHHPWLSGGAINDTVLKQKDCAQLLDNASKLTRRLGLRGLNCIDYILSGDGPVMLELNPRPSATMQLYSNLPLWDGHLQACVGELPSTPFQQAGLSAYAIVYAQEDVIVEETMFKEPFATVVCCDIPTGKRRIEKGEPICSLRVCASARNDNKAGLSADLLATLQQGIRQMHQRFTVQ